MDASKKRIGIIICAWTSTGLTFLGVLCLAGVFLLYFFFGSIFIFVGSWGNEILTPVELLTSEEWWDGFGWVMITTTICGILACASWIFLMFTPANVKFRPAKEKLFFNRDGNTIGPFTESDVNSMLAKGQLRQTDMFLREGVHDWVQVGQSELNARMPQQQ